MVYNVIVQINLILPLGTFAPDKALYLWRIEQFVRIGINQVFAAFVCPYDYIIIENFLFVNMFLENFLLLLMLNKSYGNFLLHL